MTAPIEVIYTPEIFSRQPVGGVSRYFVELVRGMRAAGQTARVVAGLHMNTYLRGLPGVLGLHLRFAAYRTVRWRLGIDRALCRAVLARHRRAVAHLTYYGDTGYLGDRPVVITVYDMIHELFQDRFPNLRSADPITLRYKRSCCERADHIIAISETTKSDLVRLFGLDPAKVTAIPLADSLTRTALPGSPAQVPSRPTEGLPYLLYVGSREGYKNFDTLLAAFASSAALRQHFRLVCFGGGPLNSEEHARIAALGVAGRVEERSGTDDELVRSYQDAAAFVYPSIYEGFGLPVLEAMGQGCPVICAQAGSLPEVAGEAAAYFDPQEIGSIRSVLENTLGSPAQLAALRAAGWHRARVFSWERCARETLAVYQRLVH